MCYWPQSKDSQSEAASKFEEAENGICDVFLDGKRNFLTSEVTDDNETLKRKKKSSWTERKLTLTSTEDKGESSSYSVP